MVGLKEEVKAVLTQEVKKIGVLEQRVDELEQNIRREDLVTRNPTPDLCSSH